MDHRIVAMRLRSFAHSIAVAAFVVACASPTAAAAATMATTARVAAHASAHPMHATAAWPNPVPANALGESWLEQKVSAGDGVPGTNFGYSLAISGTTAFISAYQAVVGGNQAQGAVYVYSGPDGAWTETQKLVADDGAAFHQFGEAIAFDGTTVLIAANGVSGFQGAVYVFGQEDGAWTQTARLTAADGAALDNFGWSVAIDGTVALIGAPYAEEGANEDQGAAYVFEHVDGAWVSSGRLVAPDGAAGDNFGRAVAIDGDSLLVGAVNAAIDGEEMQGAAYLFERSEDGWLPSQKLVASDGAAVDNLGQAVALQDGVAVVGAPIRGAAYVFERGEAGWTESRKLMPGDEPPGAAYFGYALDFDGETIVIGALNATIAGNQFQGAAYVFGRDDGDWSAKGRLVASDGAAFENLGIAVGVSGADVLAGAYYATVDGNAAEGAAYFFTRPLDERIFTDGFDG